MSPNDIGWKEIYLHIPDPESGAKVFILVNSKLWMKIRFDSINKLTEFCGKILKYYVNNEQETDKYYDFAIIGPMYYTKPSPINSHELIHDIESWGK